MSDVQHKEWFIIVLVPHIWQPLMHQNIATQSKDLEIEMKLEASPIGEIAIGMNKIGAAGQLNTSATRYQEGERTSQRPLVHSMSHGWTYQRYFP